MTDLLKLTAAARAALRAMPDNDLAAYRDRMGGRPSLEAAAAHLAALDEEERRWNERNRITPIANRTGFANRVRTERSDPALVAAVIEAKRRKFEAIEQVRKAENDDAC